MILYYFNGMRIDHIGFIRYTDEMKDATFQAEFEKLEPELKSIQAMIDAKKTQNQLSDPDRDHLN